MQTFITSLSDIIRHNTLLFQWLALISAITFVLSLLAIPWIIARLPTDFFSRRHATPQKKTSPFQPATLFLLVLRNVLGLTFLLAGTIMLFLPGQGILTIVLGLSIMIFPGKQRLLNQLINQPSVQQGLNWIRRKTGRDDFDGFSVKGL